MWKGNIYATLPADFNYGNGPLDAATRNTLIKYSEYARENYKRMRQKLTSKARVSPKRTVQRRAKPPYKIEAGISFPRENNGLVPRFDRAVKFCPHCGWNLDACAKAQAFVDGRAL